MTVAEVKMATGKGGCLRVVEVVGGLEGEADEMMVKVVGDGGMDLDDKLGAQMLIASMLGWILRWPDITQEGLALAGPTPEWHSRTKAAATPLLWPDIVKEGSTSVGPT